MLIPRPAPHQEKSQMIFPPARLYLDLVIVSQADLVSWAMARRLLFLTAVSCEILAVPRG